ncbi:MAG: flagellar protein [Anaerolineae bacterium]|nr:flagellar protein [Anaerolineae bacterium]
MINKINLPILPTQQTNKTVSESQDSSSSQIEQIGSFEDLLKSQLGRSPTVRFSAHAQHRIASRNIDFGSEEAVRLEQAIEKAANKGSRESLILMDDLALVVSIKNKIVITAVDADSRKENVFTNIDSVVLT